MESYQPDFATITEMYTTSLIDKVMSATSKQKKDPNIPKPLDRKKFRQDVFSFYEAVREEGKQKFCHVLGWQDEGETVCAAHIVPQSLPAHFVEDVFNVPMTRSNPKNAITLHQNVETGLDDGTIVFVPDKIERDRNEIVWRCVLVETYKAKWTVTGKTLWEELDGKELQFIGSNRPSSLYLYFRFLITYLNCKNRSINQDQDLKWANTLPVKGQVWFGPNEMLRGRMIASLARQASDTKFAEVFNEAHDVANSLEAEQHTTEGEISWVRLWWTGLRRFWTGVTRWMRSDEGAA